MDFTAGSKRIRTPGICRKCHYSETTSLVLWGSEVHEISPRQIQSHWLGFSGGGWACPLCPHKAKLLQQQPAAGQLCSHPCPRGSPCATLCCWTNRLVFAVELLWTAAAAANEIKYGPVAGFTLMWLKISSCLQSVGLANLTLLAQLRDQCKQASPEQRHFQTSCLDLLLRNTCCTHKALGYCTVSGGNSGPPFNPIQSGHAICESQHPDYTSPFQAAPACSCGSGWQNPSLFSSGCHSWFFLLWVHAPFSYHCRSYSPKALHHSVPKSCQSSALSSSGRSHWDLSQFKVQIKLRNREIKARAGSWRTTAHIFFLSLLFLPWLKTDSEMAVFSLRLNTQRWDKDENALRCLF